MNKTKQQQTEKAPRSGGDGGGHRFPGADQGAAGLARGLRRPQQVQRDAGSMCIIVNSITIMIIISIIIIIIIISFTVIAIVISIINVAGRDQAPARRGARGEHAGHCQVREARLSGLAL